MKFLVRQLFYILGALVALYGVVLAISLLWLPPGAASARLDSTKASASQYLTEPKYVFMTRSSLDNAAGKIILVGASNTGVGFKQSEVQALVPAVEVHNISVGGSNITQLAQIVELVREVQSPEARKHNTFVIGLWYGVFASDKARWYSPERHAGDTDIDIERYRYSFYRRTEVGAVSVLPPHYLDWGIKLIHPYLVLDKTARNLTESLRNFIKAKPAPMTDEKRNAIVIEEVAQRKYLAFWRDYTAQADALGDDQFQKLEDMVQAIVSDGGRVVLVDLPIPKWHTDGSALAADYRKHMDTLFPRLKTHPNVRVLRMDDASASDDFSDEVHPKPRATKAWAQRLADQLNSPIASN